MEIVEVRFIEDTQSAQTGWEFYPTGAAAHFYADQVAALVEQGRAVLKDTPPEEAPVPDFGNMTVKQLREEARARNITIKSNMRKADLIAAIEEHISK